MNAKAQFPAAVGGLLNDKMWRTIEQKAMALPFCSDCERAVYPPAPCCPRCFHFDLPWKKLTGRGRIVSWTRFHRTYLPAYPAPYNVIAVALEEGVVVISNLVGDEPPSHEWIGLEVNIVYQQISSDRILPRFELAHKP